MAERYPRKNTAGLEGNAAHWLAAILLQHGGETINYLGYQHENGSCVTEEMVAAVDLYRSIVCRYPGGVIERPVIITRVSQYYTGTPDYWTYDPVTCTLHVFDLKYGWGIVEPYRNLQLISYALGILDENREYIDEQQANVALHIIQPRPWHSQGAHRTWATTAVDLRPIGNQLHNKYHEAIGPDPQACSGPHCRYCNALHACHTARQASMHSVDISELPTAHTGDNEELATELAILHRAAEAIAWRKDALEERAIAKAKQGEVIPGWSMTSGLGREGWTQPPEIVKTALGASVCKDALITPKQARDAGLPASVIAQFSERKPAAAKLKPDGNRIKQLFNEVK